MSKEEKKVKQKKVWCRKCFGTGNLQNAYASPRCDNCNGNGFTFREVRKYTRKKKTTNPKP